MKLNQLQTILAKLTIPEEFSKSIMEEAKALTVDTTETLDTVLDESRGHESKDDLHIKRSPELDFKDGPSFEYETSQMTHVNALGDYDELGELGEGAMGAVHLVWDRKLKRRLAMKIMHSKLLDHLSPTARFVEEAQVSAQLQHPNIVPVHDFGTLPDGRMYFTMKQIKGRSLDTVIETVHASVKDGRFYPAEDGWTLRRLINVFHKVCQAVGYAHLKGFAPRSEARKHHGGRIW